MESAFFIALYIVFTVIGWCATGIGGILLVAVLIAVLIVLPIVAFNYVIDLITFDPGIIGVLYALFFLVLLIWFITYKPNSKGGNDDKE